MKERVLIVGSGAREHAIAAAVARAGAEVICFGSARNPGIDALCAKYVVGKIDDGPAVSAFAKEQSATLAVIGPEAPLAAGVADAAGAAWVCASAVVISARSLRPAPSPAPAVRRPSIPGN